MMFSEESTAGLYVHVPFCRRKCPYCNFYSVSVTEERLSAFTAAVCRNLLEEPQDVAIDTVYFGGGTPSLLEPAQLGQILEAAAARFSLASGAEITLEANPCTVTPALLRQLKQIGINRLSFGVQSLEEPQLQLLGRLHTARQAVYAVEAAAEAGFSNLSCDLMLALPGQTSSLLSHTIRELTALPIQHVSAYLLKVEPGTPFAARLEELHCPDADTAADLYLQTVAELEQAGFAQYEISNFAKAGFMSRHNCKYWHCAPYLGIGPSAHSCWGGIRFSVPSSLEQFLKAPRQTRVLEDAAPCTLEERILLGLRLTEGIPSTWLAQKREKVQRYETAGFFRRQGERIAFTPKGFLVSNTILAELI